MNNSLKRLLIISGLVIIPFYEIFLKALPFVRSVAPDTRAPKEILALVFALSIGLLAVFQGDIKPFRNKWFICIPVYLLLNLIMAPHSDMFVNNVESGDFYFWKPFSEVLCFTFMIIAISSMEENIEEILKVMVICGSVMAGYVILQNFGLDQFWMAKTEQNFTAVRGEALGGNLGQPTIVSSWIIMMIPLAMYLKKYWMVLLMSIACLLTQGAMVTGALILIWIISVFYRYKELRIIILISILAIGIFVGINKPLQHKITNRMDGRYEVWQNVLSDIKNGQIKGEKQKFTITGVGFGRFPFIFPDRYKSVFQQVHNDPMEFAYNCGIIGEYLLLAGIFTMILFVSSHLTPLTFSILLSFIAIFLCSLGSFPFQLGAHQFYSAILVGLLHNEKLIRRI